MTSAYDDRCASDLSNVIDGRSLSREDAAWLTRVVTGAVRPNRDKPFWDLAHFLVALAWDKADGPRVLDILLDPRLARTSTLVRRFGGLALAEGARCDERGLVFALSDREWRATWNGLTRNLALAEFLLTAEELAHFADIKRCLTELMKETDPQSAVSLLLKYFVRIIHDYRDRHLPLAPVERRFRAILAFLSTRAEGKPEAFDDDDIVAFWRQEIGAGERPLFRTIAEHFVTYQETISALGGLAGLRQATSLETIEDWADRLDSQLGDALGASDVTLKLTETLATMPDTPKILTGAERNRLIDILWLEPFHRSRPVTVWRAVSFGQIQSGIGNRLRRGSGGAEVDERVTCADAETYAALITRTETVHDHVERMIKIAAALQIPATAQQDSLVHEVLVAAESDIARVRRAGFDDRAALQETFSTFGTLLVDLRDELTGFITASRKVAVDQDLAERFEGDRPVFAAAFRDIYLRDMAHG